MLSNTLVTNEIKNSAGTEVEFNRISTEGRTTVFAAVSETPALPHRMSIAHRESGSGAKKIRESRIRFDKTVISTVDSVTPVVVSSVFSVRIPSGALTSTAEVANVIAELVSLVASLGASTTILYDGTGNGAQVLLSGGL